MPVYVNNLQEKVKVDNRLLDTLTLVVETALGTDRSREDPEVSIALVDDEYIRELNFKFRKMDRPTDVLSFPMAESTGEEPPLQGDEDNVLGDIIISMETAVRQAEEYGHSLTREMAYLTSHGIFHLMGYDHDSEDSRQLMRQKEEQVLLALNIAR
ncbi:MAG: rRNA maturation RNase YbeY [Eubacteriales bacterium]